MHPCIHQPQIGRYNVILSGFTIFEGAINSGIEVHAFMHVEHSNSIHLRLEKGENL
jgi:hypothetical protein